MTEAEQKVVVAAAKKILKCREQVKEIDRVLKANPDIKTPDGTPTLQDMRREAADALAAMTFPMPPSANA